MRGSSALVTLSLATGLFACNPNSIGRPCVNPGNQPVKGTQISSPALECPSRLCLIENPSVSSGDVSQGNDGGVFRATCTATCNSDGDCTAETKDYCKDGFVCAVAAPTGPFRCTKLCICRDDLESGFNKDPIDGGVKLPEVCNSGHG